MKIIDMDVKNLLLQTRKAEANPGGGSLLILISNLAINLSLMMDKNNFEINKNLAKVSRETLLEISKSYETYMQDDVDNFNELMIKIKEGNSCEEDFLKATDPLLNMVEKNIKGLEHINFFLTYGKKSTLTDGQIANDLLYQAILSALPTIKINLDCTSNSYDLESIKDKANKIYLDNLNAIERRK